MKYDDKDEQHAQWRNESPKTNMSVNDNMETRRAVPSGQKISTEARSRETGKPTNERLKLRSSRAHGVFEEVVLRQEKGV